MPPFVFTRLRFAIRDRIISSGLVRELFSLCNLVLYLLFCGTGGRSTSRSRYLFQAARNTRSTLLRSFIGSQVRHWLHRRIEGPPSVPLTSEPRGDHQPEFLSTGLILKAPGVAGEKGVLFLAMEGDLSPLVRSVRGTTFFEEYDVVALSSWSPPNLALFAGLAGLSRDPFFIGISNIGDPGVYEMLEPVMRPIPLMACDWLNPAEFRPLAPAERDIDIVMVANCAEYKRHWLLFDALRNMPRDLHVVLIGGEMMGRTVEDLKQEARLSGVRQDLVFMGAIPINNVYERLARARVSLILSRREGACVAVTESFFANTPVGMMKDAHVGSRAYINEASGTLLTKRKMAKDLLAFLDSWEHFTPRSWAIEHIGCYHSSRRLNEILKDHALAKERPWSRDIAPFFWRYFHPHYLGTQQAGAIAAEISALQQRYGLRLSSHPTDLEAVSELDVRLLRLAAMKTTDAGLPGLKTPWSADQE